MSESRGAAVRLESDETQDPSGIAPLPTDILDSPEAGSRAIRGGALRTAGYVGGSLLALASAPLLIRHLGVVEFGRYFTVASLIALVGGVTDVGLGAVALREYAARSGEARDHFMRQILGARLVLTAVGVLGAMVFAAIAGYGVQLVLGTGLAGAGLVILVVSQTYGVPLSVQLRLGWLTVIDLLGRSLAVGMIVVLVVTSADVVAFLAVTIPTGLITLAVTIALTRHHVPLRPSFDPTALRTLVTETLPLAAATVLGSLYPRVVVITMSLISTELALGYFGTAVRVIEAAVGIPVSLVGATFPIFARAARDDEQRLGYVLQRVSEVALIGGAWMALCTYLGAGPIAELLVDENDVGPVAAVLRILSVVFIFAFLTVTWQTALVAQRRHRDMLVVNALGLLVIVVATFVLVPLFAERGGASAIIVGDLALTAASGVALKRLGLFHKAELGVIPRVVIAAAVALTAAALFRSSDTIAVLLGSLIYFGVLGALGGIPGEVRHAFRRGALGGPGSEA